MSVYAETTGSMKIAPRGTRWNGKVPPEWIVLGYQLRSAAKLPRVNLSLEAEKFADFWTAKTGTGATKLASSITVGSNTGTNAISMWSALS